MSFDAAALFGGGGTSAPTQTAWSLYQSLMKSGDKQQAQFSQSAAVTREQDYFATKMKKISTVEEFFKDDRLVNYVLSSFSMESEAQYKGRLEKVLTQDRTDSNSLVNKLSDPKFKQLAEYLQFDTRGLDRLKLTGIQNELKTKYVQNEWEKSLGEKNPAIREAAYFARNAGNIKSVYNILGDAVLSKVVRETLGLPKEIVYQSIESQAAAIEKRLDWKKFNSALAGSGYSDTRIAAVKKEQDANTALLNKATDAVTDLGGLSSRIAALTKRASDLAGGSGSTVDPATRELQTQMMPKILAADSLLGAANDALTTAQPMMQRLQAMTTQVSSVNGGQLKDLQDDFQELLTSLTKTRDLATVVNPDTGETESIFDNGFEDIDITFTVGGEAQSFSGVSLNSLIGKLTQANSAFDAIKNKNDSAGIAAAQAKMASAMSEFQSVLGTVQQQTTALGKGVESMGEFVGEFDSEAIGTGQSSVDDARSRIDRARTISTQLRDLALEMYDPPAGYDQAAASTKIETLRTELTGLLETDAPVNLLKGNATLSVEYADGKTLTVQGVDLSAAIGDVPATLTSGSDAARFLNKIEALRTALTDSETKLSERARPLDMMSNTFDPGSVIKSDLAAIAIEARTLLNQVNGEEGNPLRADSHDQSLYSTVTSRTVTLRNEKRFTNDVVVALEAAAKAGSTDAIAKQLAQANAGISGIHGRLQADIRDITNQGTALKAWMKDNDTSAAAASTKTLVASNAFTQKFIERFLITRDQTDAAATTNPYAMLFSGNSDPVGSLLNTLLR